MDLGSILLSIYDSFVAFIDKVVFFFTQVADFISSLVSAGVQGLQMIVSVFGSSALFVSYLPNFLAVSVSVIMSISVIKLIWGR